MAKDPAFLFYYQDYSFGTRFMTYEEKGAYVDLLCHQADKGKFTLEEIEKLLGESFHLWETIKCKFVAKNGQFWNERLQEEIEKRKKYSQSRRINRINKGTYLEDMIKICFTSDKDMENGNENRNEIENVLRINGFMSAWIEWDEFRKEKKKPLTDISIKQQLNFLAKQPDPIECINQSIRNGWQGLFEVKNNGTNRKPYRKGDPDSDKYRRELATEKRPT
jgi:hypothetical protein